MIKAIVLDVGGVILRTEGTNSRSALEKKFHLAPGTAHDVVFHSAASQAASVGKVSPDAVWQNVAQDLSLSAEELEEFKHAFWLDDRIDQRLINFLESCRDTYKTALLSNAWSNLRTILARDYDIVAGKTVDYILISAELGVAKPDPRIYFTLAQTLNCDFDKILFVDDFIENIEAANSLGIQTIHYKSGMDLVNEIKSRLDHHKTR